MVQRDNSEQVRQLQAEWAEESVRIIFFSTNKKYFWSEVYIFKTSFISIYLNNSFKFIVFI